MTHRTLTALGLTVALAAPGVAWAATRDLDARASLKTTKRDGLLATQKGTVDARPFGRGTITLTTKIRRGRIDASFTVKIGRSTVRGTATGKVDVGDDIRYTGTAIIKSGTGRFAKARAKGLRFTGQAPLNGRSAKVQLRGRVTY